MNPGQKFEELIFNSFAEKGIHISRIKTRITQYKGDNEVADFYTYNDGVLLYLEAKSTQANRFSFSMIQPTQAVGLHKQSKYKGVYGGILVEMRKFKRVFYVPIEEINNFLGKKKVSMNIEDLENNAIEIKKNKYLEIDNLHKEVVKWT